ncbi:hypothetical protein EC968_001372 [Mortierella alpina]|nr:hypothetical protein EC968_001372 [Mortierella alpina]
MKLRLQSIAGSALVLISTVQFAHSSGSNTRNRDPLLESTKPVRHEVIRPNLAMPPDQSEDVTAAAVKDSKDHMFHMDILDIDEYGNDNDGALDEGDYNYGDEDEDDEVDEDVSDHDYDDEDNHDAAIDLDLNKDTDGSGSAFEDQSDHSNSRYPSSDRGFHYADPLMIPPTDQEQCHIKQKRDQTTPIRQDPSQATADGSDKEAQLRALANYEPGGACIDSFVNFALRFRERCTISCLKTLTHIFVKPDVLGLVGCFGCINFLISGISAVITDCVGLFAPYPKPSSTISAPVPTGTMRKMNLAAEGHLGDSSPLNAVHSDDQGLGSLDFAQVIHSLQNLDMNQVHDWLDAGKKIVESKAPAAKDQKVESGSINEYNPEQEGHLDEEANEEKKMFNTFIVKAASFANWTVTPAMLDATGVYERFRRAGIL